MKREKAEEIVTAIEEHIERVLALRGNNTPYNAQALSRSRDSLISMFIEIKEEK